MTLFYKGIAIEVARVVEEEKSETRRKEDDELVWTQYFFLVEGRLKQDV